MVKGFKNILKNDSKYYLIGVFTKNDVVTYKALIVEFINNELNIVERISFNSFDDDFKEKLKGNYPVILYIDGDNIISKSVESKINYRNDIIFKASLDDFHFYEYKQDNTIYASVVRKSAINNFIKQIQDHKLFVIHISFGPFVVVNMFPILGNEPNISTAFNSFKIENKKIASFSNTNSKSSYNISGEALNNMEVPLIASLLDYKYPNEQIDFNSDFLSLNKEEFKFKKLFTSFGIFTLVFFLVSLFVSHHLLNRYTEKLVEKEYLYSTSQQTIAEVSQLQEEKNLKEKILQNTGINNNSFLTKYIADIGNSVPDRITLNSIDVIPIQKKIRSKEKINFKANTLDLNGETRDDNAFNNWILKLKVIPWIKKIDIVDYSQENRNTNTFIINIKI